MIGLNRTTFFAYIRKAPFGGRLTQSQIEGIDAIFEAYEAAGGKNHRCLAYILATAFHETGGKMQPVREGFAKTDAQARKVVAKYPYGRVVAETGCVYYGRGLVQLTWAKNYKAMGEILGLPLFEKPDLALRADVSAKILVEGMIKGRSAKGDFTGKSLEDYFTKDGKADPVGARRIVNGTDKAQLIAGYYQNFVDALGQGRDGGQPDDVDPEDAEPDAPSLGKDKTTMGAITAVAGSGAVGVFSSIDSPWAFAAFAVLALGAFFFLTGRLQIVKKAGA